MVFVMATLWLAQKSKYKTALGFRLGRPLLPVTPLQVSQHMSVWDSQMATLPRDHHSQEGRVICAAGWYISTNHKQSIPPINFKYMEATLLFTEREFQHTGTQSGTCEYPDTHPAPLTWDNSSPSPEVWFQEFIYVAGVYGISLCLTPPLRTL